MQSQFEASPEFKAIYEAALTQDQTQLETASLDAGIDVFHGKYPITPIAQLALENNGSAVNFLLKNGAKSYTAVYGYSRSNLEEALRIIDQVKRHDPNELKTVLMGFCRGIAMSQNLQTVMDYLDKLNTQYPDFYPDLVEELTVGLMQNKDKKAFKSFLRMISPVKSSAMLGLQVAMLEGLISNHQLDDVWKRLEAQKNAPYYSFLLKRATFILGEYGYIEIPLLTPEEKQSTLQFLLGGLAKGGHLDELLKQFDVKQLISNFSMVDGLVSGGFFKKIYQLLEWVEKQVDAIQFIKLLDCFAYQIGSLRSFKEIEQFYTTIESRPKFTKNIPILRGSLINGLTRKWRMNDASNLIQLTLSQFKYGSEQDLIHLAFSLIREKNQFAIISLIQDKQDVDIPWVDVLDYLIQKKYISAAYELLELINQYLPEESLDLTTRLVEEYFNPDNGIQEPINKTVVLNGFIAHGDLYEEKIGISANYPGLANLQEEFTRLYIIMSDHNLNYNQIMAWKRPDIQTFLLQFIYLIGRNIIHPIYFNIAGFLMPLNLTEFSDLAKKYVTQVNLKHYLKHAVIYERIFFPSPLKEIEFKDLPKHSSPFERICQAAKKKDTSALQTELKSVSINIFHKEKPYPPVAELAAEEDKASVDFLLANKASKGWAVYGYAKINPKLAYDFIHQELKQAPYEVRNLLGPFACGLTQHQGEFSEIEFFLNWVKQHCPEELRFVAESIAYSTGVNGENSDCFNELCKQFPDQDNLLSHSRSLGLINGKHSIDIKTLFLSYLNALRSSNDQIKKQTELRCKNIILQMTRHANRYKHEINDLYEIIQTLTNPDQRDEFILSIAEGFARNGQGLEEDFIRTLKHRHLHLVSKAKSRIPIAHAWIGKIKEAIQSIQALGLNPIERKNLGLYILATLIEHGHVSDLNALFDSLRPYCTQAELELRALIAYALGRNMTKCIELWTNQLDLSIAKKVIGLLIFHQFQAEACILLRHCFETHDADYFEDVFLHHVCVLAEVQNMNELKIFLECRFLEQYNRLKEGLECMLEKVGLHHSTSDFIEFFTKIVTMYPKHVIPVFLYCVESLIRSKKFQSLLFLLKTINQKLPLESVLSLWVSSASILIDLGKKVEMHELLDAFNLLYPSKITLFLESLKSEHAMSPIPIKPSLFFNTLVLCKDPGIYPIFNQLIRGSHINKLRVISKAKQMTKLALDYNISEEEVIGWMQPQAKILLLQGIVLINPKQLTSNFFLNLLSFLIPIQKLASPIQTKNRVCQISKGYVMGLYPFQFFKHKSHFDNLFLLEKSKEEHVRPESVGERSQKRVKMESGFVGPNRSG